MDEKNTVTILDIETGKPLLGLLAPLTSISEVRTFHYVLQIENPLRILLGDPVMWHPRKQLIYKSTYTRLEINQNSEGSYLTACLSRAFVHMQPSKLNIEGIASVNQARTLIIKCLTPLRFLPDSRADYHPVTGEQKQDCHKTL